MKPPDQSSGSVVESGIANLDRMLDGGFPTPGTVYLRGDPGVGSTTMGLAFLLAEPEEGSLYIATDRTVEAVTDDLAELAPDRSEDIAIASLRETVGGFLDSASEATTDSIEGMLTQYGSRDRIVVDGLHALPRTGWADIDAESDSGDPIPVVRRIAQVGAEELGATTMLIEEEPSATDRTATAVSRIADVVLNLSWERVGVERHRQLTIDKAPAGEFDTRSVSLLKRGASLAVTPGVASVPGALTDVGLAQTGIPGLDEFLSGGLVTGAGVLIQHDGRVNLAPLYATLIAGAIKRDYVVELIPTIHLREDRLRTLLDGFDLDLAELLTSDRLFVFDMIGAWEAGQTNVFGAREEFPEVRSMIEGIAERTSGNHFRVVNADTMVHTLGVSDARRLRSFQESLVDPEDQLLHVQYPDSCDSTGVAVYEDAAEQVLHLGFDDAGRQYLTVRKSPTGGIDRRRVLNFTEDAPYLAVGHVGAQDSES